MSKRFFVYEDLIGFNQDDPYFDSLDDAINSIKEVADDYKHDCGLFNRLSKLNKALFPDEPEHDSYRYNELWIVEDTETGELVYMTYIAVTAFKHSLPVVSLVPYEQ